MKEAVTMNIVLKRPQGTVYSCEQRFRVWWRAAASAKRISP
jgi:hypothetical protein